MKAADLALFGEQPAAADDWGDDAWGDTPATPSDGAAPKRGLNIIDQSTTSDAEVKAARKAADAKHGETVKVPALGDVRIEKAGEAITGVAADGRRYPLDPTTEAAAVLPPDAPKNDVNTPSPAKATRKPKAPAAPDALTEIRERLIAIDAKLELLLSR